MYGLVVMLTIPTSTTMSLINKILGYLAFCLPYLETLQLVGLYVYWLATTGPCMDSCLNGS